MKRVIYDVPRWHVYLHRDARGLEVATERDGPVQKFEDELFERIYSGETTLLPERRQDPKLKTWAEGVHRACEELPAFSRLAAECRGDAMAAGTAVETLIAALNPQVPDAPEQKPPENIRRVIGAACEKASQAVDELRETAEGLGQVGFSRMPGTGSGFGGTLPASSIRALAARLRSDTRLKQIALLAGRFKRIAAFKRRQKVKHGADEIADIEQGADLGRLLPSELLKLVHPRLRLAFMRSYVERAAMQYQLVGNEPLGKGPLVVLLDKSGSMDGPRDVWATALTLALLEQAHRERRTFALVSFDYHVKYEAVVKPGEPLPEDALFTACAGGTEIAAAMTRGLELIRSAQGALRKADVVLITDGGSDSSAAPKLREGAQQLGVTILGLGIGVEREWLQPWCDDIQAVTELSRLDDEAASKLFAQ
ncbi:vWA domain-containing protein [Anaeromyxobacter sp. SG26]|uniref:vWA domain-containing protein n=1 Tax=Anaeromyxobacter sp. SG26 TaxID=2925407 RepID=UPI001F59FCC5|nr:VWA domain-containing protein [Anaeromyxobacter sp. SG26]